MIQAVEAFMVHPQGLRHDQATRRLSAELYR